MLTLSLAHAIGSVSAPALHYTAKVLRAFCTFRSALRIRSDLLMASLLSVIVASLTMCGYNTATPNTAVPNTAIPKQGTVRLIAGSGFSTYEPMLKRFAQDNGIDLQIDYKGSIDIMRMLEDGSIQYDAIWEADSLWTSMGDKKNLIRDSKSIACSPVAFGVKRSIAQDLGWIGRRDVRILDILNVMESGKVRTMMTSATQSNSGASAYFGFMYAFAGMPDVLTADILHDPALQAKTKRILGKIDRTSESSGWLRDLFVAHYDDFDAMFNYESHILLTNQELAKKGRDPLYVVYPYEGLGTADFPLSFVKKQENADKEPLFLKLQQYLLSDAGQKEIASKGRRIGALCDKMDPAFNKTDWGVDLQGTNNEIRYPIEPVIREAFDLYQTDFRKPSFTVFALDFSGSMMGAGERQLKQAMRTLLDQDEARKVLLQSSPDDVTVVLIFNHEIENSEQVSDWTVAGNDPSLLRQLNDRVTDQKPGGNTNIYAPVALALDLMKSRGIGDRLPAVILMTDGQSNVSSLVEVKQAIARTGLNKVPVYSITFGDANVDQLKSIADLTGGRIFDGTKDLIGAFRAAKGNN